MRGFLQSELARRQGELKALEAQVAVLRVEVHLLTELLARAPHEAPAAELRRSGGDAERGSEAMAARSDSDAATDQRRPRSKSAIASGLKLSRKWALVRDEAVRRYPSYITSREIRVIHQRHGFGDTSSSNIRSHFYNGALAGLYERVAPAKYRATQKAAESAGFPLGTSGHEMVQKEEASDDTSAPHRPSEASNGAGDWVSPGTP